MCVKPRIECTMATRFVGFVKDTRRQMDSTDAILSIRDKLKSICIQRFFFSLFSSLVLNMWVFLSEYIDLDSSIELLMASESNDKIMEIGKHYSWLVCALSVGDHQQLMDRSTVQWHELIDFSKYIYLGCVRLLAGLFFFLTLQLLILQNDEFTRTWPVVCEKRPCVWECVVCE